ncbi:MAG TPA: energy transducer TonB [Thermoanaerobaculia bacterium]|nr:energy transducer TonB [Thermoanaerobaculia bacterium]
MFESVAPQQFVRRSRKAFYEALPASLAIHALIAGAVFVGDVWTVILPSNAPAQPMTFVIADLPPPPPPPPPPPKPLAAQLPATRQLMKLSSAILAPTVIPEEIPVARTAVVSFFEDASPKGAEEGVPFGEIGGVFGGVTGGELGGTFGGTRGGVVAESNRVTVERDRPLPMYPLSQVYPIYPEEARVRAWEDQLVVRYVVGKDGRVKDVTVISPPERALFVEATVRAIRNWRFRPLIEGGQRKEVVHELTVLYRLNYVS